jgi:hypothetical protein
MSKFLKILPRDGEVIAQQLAMKVILSKENIFCTKELCVLDAFSMSLTLWKTCIS